MPKKSIRKRLTTRKNRPTYGRKKREKENELAARRSAKQNEISCSLASTTSTNNEEIIQTSLGNHHGDGDTECPEQEQMPEEIYVSLPSASPPTSPVPSSTFNGENDCLISPTTGVLRSRNNIFFNDEVSAEEAPIKKSLAVPLVLLDTPEASANDNNITSFSCGALREIRLEPSIPSIPSGTSSSGNFPNPLVKLKLKLTPENNTDEVFTVSDMCLVDTVHSETPSPTPEEMVTNTPEIPLFNQDSPFWAVLDRLRLQMFKTWEVSLPGTNNSFILRKTASEEFWGVVQRSVSINVDGTVQLVVHNHYIALDHPIWQELPCRVCLTDRESVNDFVQYVLEVVNVIRCNIVCMGIPEPECARLAAKNAGLVFDCNSFKETRYTVTYRSVNCEILLSTKIKVKRYCSACAPIRGSILRRLKNKEQEPELNANVKKRSRSTQTIDPLQKNRVVWQE
ncbi:uncharacterized protein LOC113213271 isoform X1 [Frankliniella occidentalis]|uniref:Uncharacterized protein LOC113213271 isoform X1 n=2 Tax=Frankliniella occidentalis TaxID=133901 RepID=A0A6J1T441_FRAOC|nr:uncharacterized protein LOC113213271 isoform X1 [Frankliniella occidentalis]